MIHDALVIGGGPAGSTAAILLAAAGWSVAIVEKSRFPRRKVCGEFVSATSAGLLDRLGIGEAFRSQAGPDIRRVGFFGYGSTIIAPMPKIRCGVGWGRALGRATLDSLLLQRAASAGALVLQPAAAVRLSPSAEGHICEVAIDGRSMMLSARVVIAAHGSWERGIRESSLTSRRAFDLLAFKAHFVGGSLPPDLMPLIAFPGGYGGLAHADGGRMSFSLCIRRDVLEAARRRFRDRPAAEAVFAHVAESCRGVRDALADAERDGAWLAAGPVRPGIRNAYADDVFAVGNLAGEAHPVIAEGISMAIQSSSLLAAELVRQGAAHAAKDGRALAGTAYSAAWRKCFAKRIHAAGLFAGLAMQPSASALIPLLERFPSILTLGARLSGKTMLPPAGFGGSQPTVQPLF